MTLSDLAALGSFVGGVAVLISLVYLALQVRQAEKNQQAAIRTGRATRMIEMNIAATDPAVAEAIAKGAADITPTQFANWVDRILSEVTLAAPADSFAQWKTYIAASNARS